MNRLSAIQTKGMHPRPTPDGYLHNHMLDDEPRLFFMHSWANDDAEKLAKSMCAALDKVNVARS